MLRTPLASSILFTLLCGQTLAQSLPSMGSIYAKPNEAIRRHIGLNGKPCIALDSSVRPQIINKDIYEHWIEAANSCGETIKLQVFYHKSDDCIEMSVPPWQSKHSVLGIYPHLKEFQYDAEEQF